MRCVARTCMVAALVGILGALPVTEAGAVLTVYYDRGLWEAALSAPVHTEDLESDEAGLHETPYETGNGFLLTSTSDPISIGIYDSGPIDGTRYGLFRNFCGSGICEGLTFTFPDGGLQTGFGLDYRVADDIWELHVADEVFIIAENTSGFIGFIDDTSSLASFLLFCDEYVQNGFGFDNVSYSPPCEMDLPIYHDRAAWEAALACPVYTEDFESDELGLYYTPFETGNGFLLTSTADPITVGIYDSGPIDGTQYAHFRDFCGGGICLGVTFTPPGGGLHGGFGFDYSAEDDTWELIVGCQVITIAENTEGFIGVIDETGLLTDFRLHCDEYVQNGLSVDNVSYIPYCASPVMPATWGQIKSLYR